MSLTGQESTCFPKRATVSPVNLIPRSHRSLRLLTRKENSSRGFDRRLCVRLRCRSLFSRLAPRERKVSPAGLGISTQFPFDRRRYILQQRTFRTAFAYHLGSTHPCPIDVHMEPFSTSVFKVLIWIFATTTKICTRDRFTQVYTQGCLAIPTPSYSPFKKEKSKWRPSIGHALKRHPFSGLVDSAGELLHTP